MTGFKIISTTRVGDGVWRYELERKESISVIADGESSDYLYKQMRSGGHHDISFDQNTLNIDGYKMHVRAVIGNASGEDDGNKEHF